MPTIQLQLALTLSDDTAKVLADILGPTLRHALSDSSGGFDSRRQPDQNPLFAGKKPPEDQGALIDSREVAKLLKLSPRKVARLIETEGIPAPIRIGRAVRWSLEVIHKWIADGCPAMPRATSPSDPPATTEQRGTRQSPAARKLETTPGVKSNPAEGQKQQHGSTKKETPSAESSSPNSARPAPNRGQREARSAERVDPLTVLLSELGIDESSLPSITNGDLMRIAEVDLVTMHGWQYLNRSLPDEALTKIKNHFRGLVNPQQTGE
jgi:excisionase family DNA binding protein